MELTSLETGLLIAVVVALGVLVWLFNERARLRAQRDLAEQRLVDRDEGEERLRDSFRALAGETLEQSNRQFLQLAERTLAAQKSSASADYERRRSEVDGLVKPIATVLQRAERQLRLLEKDRSEAYAGLRSQVEGVIEANVELRDETAKLARAMSQPNVRGRYGEIQLQRVAELAGMQQYCDFSVQTSVRDADGQLLRPDMVVRLPNGRLLAVDAKASLASYLEALEAQNDADRELHLEHFAGQVMRQVQELSKKGYWKQFPESPEFVVMFVPGDQFIDAALERRPELIEEAAKRNVILASPSTLIGLLRAVHVGWREQKLTEGAQELFDLGHELHDRVAKAMEHASRVGDSLETTVRRYNKLVGSVEARLLPTLRKFEERGVRVGEEVRELKAIDGGVRKPTASALGPGDEDKAELPSAGDEIEVVPTPAPDSKAPKPKTRAKRQVKRSRAHDEPAAKLVREPRAVRRPRASGPLLPGFGPDDQPSGTAGD